MYVYEYIYKFLNLFLPILFVFPSFWFIEVDCVKGTFCYVDRVQSHVIFVQS